VGLISIEVIKRQGDARHSEGKKYKSLSGMEIKGTSFDLILGLCAQN